MRVKFTIAVCALLVLGLAVSQADAQGYRVSSRPHNVVQSGNNQELGAIRLTYITAVGTAAGTAVHIPANDTVKITFGGLTITNAAHISVVANEINYLTEGTEGTTDADGATVAVANDEATNAGTVTITIETAETITLMGIRADVTGMDAGEQIVAIVTSTGGSDDFIDAGQASVDSIGVRVATVMDGLDVTAVGQVTVLTCDGGIGADRIPSITVAEGFNAAWETGAGGGFLGTDNGTDTHIRVVVANVPVGVSFRWPGQGNFEADGTTALLPADAAFFANPMDRQDHDGDATTSDREGSVGNTDGTPVADGKTLVGTLMYTDAGDSIGDDKTKRWATYRFVGLSFNNTPVGAKDHDALTNTFKVSPMVMVDVDKAGKGGVSDVWAQLWPGARSGEDNNRATVLSYSHPVETKDEGYFVNVAECVTYLLFPYITCGAHADWDTGIAIANTSMDDGIFGISKGATAQTGSVTIYAYPTGAKTADYSTAEGYTGKPSVAMISGGLAGGDSIAMACSGNPMLAGMQGYAIVKAGFRHAHGMAFVLNTASGAVDAVHGYIALVIPDPEFGGGRAPTTGETLGH